MTFILIALGAGVAVSVELLEALAIVLTVAVSRRWGDALIGAAGGALACGVLAAILGPVVLASVPLGALRILKSPLENSHVSQARSRAGPSRARGCSAQTRPRQRAVAMSLPWAISRRAATAPLTSSA